MADEEHLAILKQGVKAWNAWREENPEIKPELNGANLSAVNLSGIDLNRAYLARAILEGADLSGANVSQVSFGEAKLREINLCQANLYGADFRYAEAPRANLSGANLQKAYLFKADLHEANLYRANLYQASLDEAILRDVDLRDADLSEANLFRVDISGADLRKACLKQANLCRTEALVTNFTAAILTGACIEDWHINSGTNLDGVICDYVYLRQGQQERRPHCDTFAPGDLAKLVQDSLETVDLIFDKGVDWRAFTYSFHKTQIENEGTPLAIRSIENKGDGVVLIRVSIPQDIDKGKVYNDFIQGYEFAQKALGSQYQSRLEDKDKEINRLFCLVNQFSEKLGEVPKIMAETPKIQQSFHAPVGSVAGEVQGDQKTIQHNYAPEQKQTLTEAATEIHNLLKQLQSEGFSLDDAQKQVASNLVNRAQNNPTFKSRLESWARYLGDAAANGLIGEAVVTVFKSVLQSQGIPLP